MSKSHVTKLSEFLEARGFASNEPYSWARAFYRYTPCGPWAVFIIRKSAASTSRFDVEVRYDSKRRRVKARPIEGPDGLPSADVLSRLGFAADGWPDVNDALTKNVPAYLAALEAFLHQIKGDPDFSITIRESQLRARAKDCYVSFEVCVRTPEYLEEIYYEKLGQDPSVRVDDANCAGIKIGSIVEGSDVEVGPWAFLFPFEMAEFEAAEKTMEDETSFYWERDNSQWYEVRSSDPTKSGTTYHLHNTWGEIKWARKPKNLAVVQQVEAFVASAEAQDYEWHPVPGLDGWEIREYLNEATF